MENERILRRKDVLALIGLGKSSLYQMMAEGRFPQPKRIGKRAVGWPLKSIMHWLDTCPISRRNAGSAIE